MNGSSVVLAALGAEFPSETGSSPMLLQMLATQELRR